MNGEINRYKSRLLLGEADFSFACALVKKQLPSHPNFGQAIIATAFESEEKLREKYQSTFDAHVQFLREHSVTLLFNVDAQELHLHPVLSGKKFDCVHFNFPHDGSSYKTGRLKEILRRFFESAYRVQDLAGRVYMALPKPNDPNKNQFYKLVSYNIYDNSRGAGYLLAKKRPFSNERYPGYGHMQTQKSAAASIAQFGREYIFEKTDLTPEEILEGDCELLRKPVQDRKTGGYVLPEIKTDQTSTDYFFLDPDKPNLFRIHDERMARQWLDKLYHKRNALFQGMERGIFEPAKMHEFFKNLQSMELYLSGTSKKNYYTHPTELGWKNHISIWTYRSVNLTKHIFPKSEDNLELKNRFVSFLIDHILKKSNTPKHNPFVVYALQALFYLFAYQPKRILTEAVKVINNEVFSYRAKAIAFSILMKGVEDPEFGSKTLIPLLIRTIGFDPRLDWMIFFILGKFDVTDYLLQPEYKECFNRINDFRLISRMLESCNFKTLNKKKEKLPNVHYQDIVIYLRRRYLKHPLDEKDQMIKEAINIPSIFSLRFERDLITWESSENEVGLCPDIFMPAQSIIANTLITNLQDRHQEVSFMALGRCYLQGSNGCEINHRKALSFFKVPADNGSIEALYQIVYLYSQGCLDISSDDLDNIILHCDKLKNFSNLKPEQKSFVFATRGIIMFFKGDLKGAGTFFNVAWRMNPNNESALFYKAVLEILGGNSQGAQELLGKVKNSYQFQKRGLAFFLQSKFDKMHRLSRRATREEFSLMAMICGVIAYHQNKIEQSLKCFSFVLSNYHSHPTAMDYCQKINPDLDHQQNMAVGKYELIFKKFPSMDEYLQEKSKLRLRCSSNRGFFIFIAESKQMVYLNLSTESAIEEECAKVVTTAIIESFQNNDRDQVHASMLQLHQFITERFKIKTKPSLTHQLDEFGRLKIIDNEEELQQIERQIADQKEKRSVLTINGDDEQKDPEDID